MRATRREISSAILPVERFGISLIRNLRSEARREAVRISRESRRERRQRRDGRPDRGRRRRATSAGAPDRPV